MHVLFVASSMSLDSEFGQSCPTDTEPKFSPLACLSQAKRPSVSCSKDFDSATTPVRCLLLSQQFSAVGLAKDDGGVKTI